MSELREHKKELARELKRRIIAAGGQGVSVRGGRGTAWAWIEVEGPGGQSFTAVQRKAVEEVCGPCCANVWVGRLDEVERILERSPVTE